MSGSRYESALIHCWSRESDFSLRIQRVNAEVESRLGFAYSAAEAATTSFGFLLVVVVIMKSLMRGTISERKREPLNTP